MKQVFHNTGKTINSIIGNGKRFMAYDLVTALEKQNETMILKQLKGGQGIYSVTGFMEFRDIDLTK